MAVPDIRPYRESDLPILARIYQDAIRIAARDHYTAQQVDAWAGNSHDKGHFRKWIEKSNTRVAVDAGGAPIGFAGLENGGRIAALFVDPNAMRKGVASALVEHLLAAARSAGLERVTTEASELSRPVFERFGFEVTEFQHTEINGVAFSRYAMQVVL